MPFSSQICCEALSSLEAPRSSIFPLQGKHDGQFSSKKKHRKVVVEQPKTGEAEIIALSEKQLLRTEEADSFRATFHVPHGRELRRFMYSATRHVKAELA